MALIIILQTNVSESKQGNQTKRLTLIYLLKTDLYLGCEEVTELTVSQGTVMNLNAVKANFADRATLQRPHFARTVSRSKQPVQKNLRKAFVVNAALGKLKESLVSFDKSRSTSINPEFANAAIKDNPDFASVTSGNILVNGQSIAINFSRDSLADIIARIDGLDGIEAQVSPRVVIDSSKRGSKLNLVDNGTGFLAAVYLAGGTTQPNDVAAADIPERSESLHQIESEQLSNQINAVLDDSTFSGAEETLGRLRNSLLEIVRGEPATKASSSATSTRFDDGHVGVTTATKIRSKDELQKESSLATKGSSASQVNDGVLGKLFDKIDSFITESQSDAIQPGSFIDLIV